MYNETLINCILVRANGTLDTLKDIRKCESKAMIEMGYTHIEGLIGGMIKMIEREQKERERKNEN